MATTGFQVTGTASVVRALVSLGAEIEHPATALAVLATAGAAALRHHAPRKSGRLGDNTTTEVTRGRAAVSTTVPYAGVINNGWPRRNIAPARYREAADQELEPLTARILDAEIHRQIAQRGLLR